MIEQATEATVADIVSFLQARKNQGQPLRLFVGSRAGALLGDDNLYKTLMHDISTTNDVSDLLKQPAPLLESHLRALNNLSTSDRFKECYDILSKHFSESGIHTVLVHALAPFRHRKVEELIAGFFKGSFFDLIITTNIDPLLEDACDILWSMRRLTDYQLFSYERNKSEEIKRGVTRYGRIVKIFGDLNSLKYKTAGNEFNLEVDQIVKEYLQKKLAEDILVIGYDPTWDRPIEQAFPESGGVVWYVNDELPAQNTHLMRVLNQRKGRYLTLNQGTVNDFLKAVYDEIGEGVSRNADAPQSQSEVRKKAFISYNHKNKEQLERLQVHLKGYLHVGEDLMDYWDDTQISSGANWEEEIKEALKGTKVAVLLVSADFLASDFIRQYELPTLLKAAQAKEITLLSVLLGPCAFARMPLFKYQAISGVSQPLMGMTPYEQDVIWAKLAERIFDILNSRN